MGGLVALRVVQSGGILPSSLVLSSPLLGVKVHVSRFKRFLGRALVQILPKTRFRNGLDPRNMTSDEEFARHRREDPLIVRTVTASWFFAMESAIAEAHRDARQISVPVLALQGLSDLTTDGDVLSSWLAATTSNVSELVALPNHVHELLHETDWRQTLDLIVEWLERTGTRGV
jgi:lysophospholipase